jgi:hypothetical protein
MNLEERMAFRRELLFQAIKSAMDSSGVPAESYHFRVSRTDRRGHAYAVMVDLSNVAVHDERGSLLVLNEIGKVIARHAKAQFKLEVTGVYWCVGELKPAVDSGSAATDAQLPASDGEGEGNSLPSPFEATAQAPLAGKAPDGGSRT